jgi:hypothetical protein
MREADGPREMGRAEQGAVSDRSSTSRAARSSPRRGQHWWTRVLIAAISTPAAVILLAGVVAAVGVLGDLWGLGHALAAHALGTVPATYGQLATAERVALVSGAFWALVCALVIVAVGCRGRGWWRLYLIPGVLLSAVMTIFFLLAAEWCVAAMNLRLNWPQQVWDAWIALALADGVLVAAGVGGIGAGPLGSRRARMRWRLAKHRASGTSPRQTQPVPVVRFGPRTITGAPLSSDPSRAQASAESPADMLAAPGVPTAEELRAVFERRPEEDGSPALAPVADSPESDAAPEGRSA